MSKSSPDTPDQLRLYHIGMHYMQIIQRYRIAGDTTMQNYYTKLFVDLCRAITENPKEAAKVIEDDITKLIQKANIGKNALLSEINTATTLGNAEAAKHLFTLTDKPKKTCEILTYCLEKHVPPPPLEMQSYEYEYAVTDQSIKPNELKFHLKTLDVILAKPRKSQFFFEFEFPACEVVRSDEYSPGQINYQNTFECIKRNLPQSRMDRYLKRRIVIKLYEITKKLLKREENIIAEIQLPITTFGNAKSFSKVVMLNPVEKGSSDQFNIDISMVISAPLLTKQMQKRKVEYFVIKQGTQIQLPWVKSPREMKSLTKEEALTLTADLKALPKIPELEFIPLSWAQNQLDLYQYDIDVFKKHHVVVSQSLIEKRDKYQNQLSVLKTGLSQKKIDLNQYKNQLSTILKEQALKVKALTPEEMPLKPQYLERITIIKQEFDQLKKMTGS